MLHNKFEITDEEIRSVEKYFLNDGKSFYDSNNERINFIKCIDKSIHVQACPGSGKTTALLAKLYLLSDKKPFENNRGICVLTHTNVAIDIIKEKLGEKANKILSYPNFFGTIQSFVDNQLAIPFYTKKYNYRPLFIDTDIQKVKMINTYFLNNISKQTFNKAKQFLIATDNAGKYTFCKKEGEYIIVNSTTKKNMNIKKPRSKSDWSDSEKNQIKDALRLLKIKVLKQDRVLSFDDAYDFAKIYLNEYTNLKNIFSSRFKYVFIDEAQDTSAIQKEIIESLFNENSIIQWIGDINQAIMNDNFSEASWKPVKDDRYDVLKITDSKRISQPIANIIKTVAVESYVSLRGNQVVDLKPVIIFFDESNIDNVLPKFAELFIEKKAIFINEEKTIWEISKLSGNPIKAVGWVGKEKDKALCIPSYFKDFCKVSTNKRKQNFPNFFTMYELSKNVNPKEFKNRIMNCILESLYISSIYYNNKNFTKTYLIDYLTSTNDSLLKELNSHIVNIYSTQICFDDFSSYVIRLLEDDLNLPLNDQSKEYLLKKEINEIRQEQAEKNNIFKLNLNGTDISFDLDTVHSVKGETHTALLYLDTKFYKNSIEYIYNQLQGSNYNQFGNNRQEKALRIAHVAFSRPTHLLCIAVNKNSLNENNLSSDKFEIISLT